LCGRTHAFPGPGYVYVPVLYRPVHLTGKFGNLNFSLLLVLPCSSAYSSLHSRSVRAHYFLSFRTSCHCGLIRKRQNSLLQPFGHPSQISSPDKPVYNAQGHAMVHKPEMPDCDQPYWKQAAGFERPFDPPAAVLGENLTVLEQVT
jgi:hypothetical protein